MSHGIINRDGEYFEVRRNGQTVESAVKGAYFKKGFALFRANADVQEGDLLVRKDLQEELLVVEVEVLKVNRRPYELKARFRPA